MTDRRERNPMRRSTVTVLSFALLASGVSTVPAAASGSVDPRDVPALGSGPVSGPSPGKPDLSRLARWVPGQLLVQWSPRVRRVEARAVHAQRGARVLQRIDAFGGIDLVELPRGLSVREGVARYERDPRVAVAEPNLLRPTLDHVPGTLDAPSFGELWGLENTGQSHPVSPWSRNRSPAPAQGNPGADARVRGAWEAEHGEREPVIAVVDSGVRVSHPDLSGRLWSNPNPGADKDGCTHLHGCNFGSGSRTNLGDAAPGGGHGTHVAGTIAARHDNGTRAVGVCPHCRIMVLKFDGTLASELKALDYARRHRADVVNGSYGGPIWSRLERRAIRRLHRAGILAVFAAGNESLDNDVAANGPNGGASPTFPASYTVPNIISVAATNHRDQLGYMTDCDRRFARWRCAFSSFGAESVHLGAPGVDILSAAKGGGYRVFDGTSMAAPHVAGAAGLVMAARPSLGHLQVKHAILNSVDTPASLRRAWSFVFKGRSATGRFTQTGGRLNAEAALTAPVARPTRRSDGTIAGAARAKRVNRGRVAYPHDANDVYRMRLRKGRDYVVRLRVPAGKDYDLWVWKPGTIEIWQFEAACLTGAPRCRIVGSSFQGPGRDEVVRFRARKTGIHYFHVVAWYKHAGRYRLTIRRA
jgi:subtilisin family serine protease